MAKSISTLAGFVAVILLGGCGIGVCSVGQELAPGQSCEVPDAGTFSVREDGCAGEVPVIRVDAASNSISMKVSSGSLTFVDGKMCTKGYVESHGFRASEIPETSSWRIDSMP